MKNSFWGLIWSSFNEIQGVLLGLLGFLGSIALIRYPFNTSIPLDLVIIVSFFTLLLIATLLSAVNTLLRQKQKLESEVRQLQETNQKLESEVRQLQETNQKLDNIIKQGVSPKILRAKKDGNNNFVCLLEASNLFVIEMLISFYYTDEDGFERLIGEGFVEYINPNDGKIQAIIDKPKTVYQTILDRLVNNDSKVFQATVVRPGILRKHTPPSP
jgi:cell division protein FtsL